MSLRTPTHTYVHRRYESDEFYDRLADPWMTLAGYFNSIRELAGTRRLVEDDIRARLRDADQRGLAKRRVRALEELTSRKSGTDIPKILERLEATFDKTLEAQRAARLVGGALGALELGDGGAAGETRPGRHR